MAEGKHREIELKYLIRRPDAALLLAQTGCEVWKIVQIYLEDGEDGQTRRIRRVEVDGRVEFYRTFKRRLTALSSEEDEERITEAEYMRYAAERDAKRAPILKTRYRVPWRGRVLEFDFYPFWEDRAILEIELSSELEVPDIPDWVRVVRDVTGEKAYKNRQLARRVPMEAI